MPVSKVLRERKQRGQPLIVGISGAQGTGKSTLARAIGHACTRYWGWRCAILSLDDLYLSRDRRAQMARSFHPLFATRGVPGTHDVMLGEQVLGALRSGQCCRLPRFDKGLDEPCPRRLWPRVSEPVDLVLFEGWCLGLPPEPEACLLEPINELEALADPHGVWRRHVNRWLGGEYTRLFAYASCLLYLWAPDWESVCRWRSKQEGMLPSTKRMNTDELARFMLFFERLTRHGWRVMPQIADIVVRLDEEQRVLEVRGSY